MIQGRLRRLTQTAIVMALLAASVLVMAACGGSAEASGGGGTEKLQIVTTTGQIGDIARHVGGEFVEVTALMGPGVDPHLLRRQRR